MSDLFRLSSFGFILAPRLRTLLPCGFGFASNPRRPCMSDLTPQLNQALEPLLRALPPDEAMAQLVVREPGDAKLAALVQAALEAPGFKDKPALAAAVWLYVDELNRSHEISQGIEDAT